MTDTAFDLYAFPESHVGRKTYVGVQGHSRSVPKLYTYRGSDGRNHVLPEFGGSWDGFGAAQSAQIMRDIGAYTSVVDGTHITSRSQHRDHMRRHDMIEVGNERPSTPRPQFEMARSGHDIKRALDAYRR